MGRVYKPRHWAGVPGVMYPEDLEPTPAQRLADEQALLKTHCPTREVCDALGINCNQALRWLRECDVPQIECIASWRKGSRIFFWERKAAMAAIRKYRRKKGRNE